jgi:hypothetical protein
MQMFELISDEKVIERAVMRLVGVNEVKPRIDVY